MKKQFTLFALILSIYAFAQNSEKYTLQDIQREFTYKKYSPEVLKKFNTYLLNNQYYTFSEEIPGKLFHTRMKMRMDQYQGYHNFLKLLVKN